MKTESRPPYNVRRCENLGLIDQRAHCFEKTYDTLEKAAADWKEIREVGTEFVRLVDGDGFILADYLNFFSEKDGKQISYEMVTENPIPIIIAAKVAKKVAKEVVKRVEEKKKE